MYDSVSRTPEETRKKNELGMINFGNYFGLFYIFDIYLGLYATILRILKGLQEMLLDDEEKDFRTWIFL